MSGLRLSCCRSSPITGLDIPGDEAIGRVSTKPSDRDAVLAEARRMLKGRDA
jgi:hypothetical protein